MPHRNDRPKFLEQFHRILSRQTVKPDILEIVDYEPKSNQKDITQRYVFGYDKLRAKRLDVIAFMEIDDWYSPNYCEVMLKNWDSFGRPQLFGIDHTVYYHLAVKKSFIFKHPGRSSMMNTLLVPDLDINWCADDYPYTDAFLWKLFKGVSHNPKQIITLGIKHGIGMSGGRWHTEGLQRYNQTNVNLESLVGEDIEFYNNIYPETTRLIRTKKNGLCLFNFAK